MAGVARASAAYDRAMALIRITRRSALDPPEAWRRLTRWERHADRIPLTRIALTTPPPGGQGTRFVARTGIARAGFDDPMEVVRWEPPGDGHEGLCRLEKRGSVVTGWAELSVRAHGTGCEVEWREDLRVRGVPALFDGVTAGCGRAVFGRALDALLDDPGIGRRP